ncbi:hypothetical protein BBJ28_00025848 [Nothophytophthora sp. Chile5]|nr:hypothetical protein BBJ28_00025848 [Nothophytophthora sp. Chile5]
MEAPDLDTPDLDIDSDERENPRAIVDLDFFEYSDVGVGTGVLFVDLEYSDVGVGAGFSFVLGFFEYKAVGVGAGVVFFVLEYSMPRSAGLGAP